VQFFCDHHELNKARALRATRMPNNLIWEGITEFSSRDPDASPYSDQPYHWAPFVYVGW
jgi:hypothetical protein